MALGSVCGSQVLTFLFIPSFKLFIKNPKAYSFGILANWANNISNCHTNYSADLVWCQATNCSEGFSVPLLKNFNNFILKTSHVISSVQHSFHSNEDHGHLYSWLSLLNFNNLFSPSQRSNWILPSNSTFWIALLCWCKP